ncbi:MAG: InlB B-repeat-containing protein [Butyricicoccaceae bacterium]
MQHATPETDTYNASEIATANFATLRHSSGGSSSSSTPTNTVSASTASNGKVSLDKSTAKKGNTVTVTVTPDAGYQLDKLTVTDAKGKTVDVTDKGNGKFTFTMPDSKVTITPTFSKIEDVKPSKN